MWQRNKQKKTSWSQGLRDNSSANFCTSLSTCWGSLLGTPKSGGMVPTGHPLILKPWFWPAPWKSLDLLLGGGWMHLTSWWVTMSICQCWHLPTGVSAPSISVPPNSSLVSSPRKRGFTRANLQQGLVLSAPPPKYAICILPIHMHLHPDFRSGGNVALSFLFHFQCVLHCLSALLWPPGPCRVLGGYYFST